MIKNKDKFPDVDFLPDSKIRPVGTVGSTRLVLLGFENGTNAPVVSRSNASEFDVQEDFFAVPLYELMNHSQDPIDITGKLQRQ